MGGSSINTTSEDEFVEMIATLLYTRNTEHVVFDIVDPINEPDWNGIEGPQVGATQYTRLLRKLSVKLDGPGLGDIRFLGPNTISPATGWTHVYAADDERQHRHGEASITSACTATPATQEGPTPRSRARPIRPGTSG